MKEKGIAKEASASRRHRTKTDRNYKSSLETSHSKRASKMNENNIKLHIRNGSGKIKN